MSLWLWGRTEQSNGLVETLAWSVSCILANALVCALGWRRCFSNNYLYWASIFTWLLINSQGELETPFSTSSRYPINPPTRVDPVYIVCQYHRYIRIRLIYYTRCVVLRAESSTDSICILFLGCIDRKDADFSNGLIFADKREPRLSANRHFMSR